MLSFLFSARRGVRGRGIGRLACGDCVLVFGGILGCGKRDALMSIMNEVYELYLYCRRMEAEPVTLISRVTNSVPEALTRHPQPRVLHTMDAHADRASHVSTTKPLTKYVD